VSPDRQTATLDLRADRAKFISAESTPDVPITLPVDLPNVERPSMERHLFDATVVVPAGRWCLLSPGDGDDDSARGSTRPSRQRRTFVLLKVTVVAPDVAPGTGVILRGR
jgi:hypothetical protein